MARTPKHGCRIRCPNIRPNRPGSFTPKKSTMLEVCLGAGERFNLAADLFDLGGVQLGINRQTQNLPTELLGHWAGGGLMRGKTGLNMEGFGIINFMPYTSLAEP